MDGGVIVAAGTPAELTRADASDGIRFVAPPNIDVASLSSTLGAPVRETTNGSYIAEVEPTSRNVATLTGWLAEHDLALDDLQAGRRPLEDLFVRLTQSATETEQARAAEAARRARRRQTTT